MDTVQQDAFAMKELLDEGGEGLTGLARALLEAGVLMCNKKWSE